MFVIVPTPREGSGYVDIPRGRDVAINTDLVRMITEDRENDNGSVVWFLTNESRGGNSQRVALPFDELVVRLNYPEEV